MIQNCIRVLVLLLVSLSALGFSGVGSRRSSKSTAAARGAAASTRQQAQCSPLFRHSPPIRIFPLNRNLQSTTKIFMTADDDAGDDDESATETDNKGLLEKVDDFGLSLKPKAIKLKEKRDEVQDDKKRQIWLTLRVCGLFTLFIAYRAYRGLFVLLPAVFREVYSKMEASVDSPFTEDPQDINPETGKVRWRTRITVAVLSAIVTFSYVATGLIRIAGKFLQTVLSTANIMNSFEAAADEVEVNEGKIRKMTDKEKGGGTSGLAP